MNKPKLGFPAKYFKSQLVNEKYEYRTDLK